MWLQDMLIQSDAIKANRAIVHHGLEWVCGYNGWSSASPAYYQSRCSDIIFSIEEMIWAGGPKKRMDHLRKQHFHSAHSFFSKAPRNQTSVSPYLYQLTTDGEFLQFFHYRGLFRESQQISPPQHDTVPNQHNSIPIPKSRAPEIQQKKFSEYLEALRPKPIGQSEFAENSFQDCENISD